MGPRAREPLERVQERVEVLSACHVIATAIDEHVEGLSDPAKLGHISSGEASASSGRMAGRAPLGFLDRGRGEIHSDDVESVRREQEGLNATPAAEVEGGSTRRQIPCREPPLDL
jgi:hypothetical protein